MNPGHYQSTVAFGRRWAGVTLVLISLILIIPLSAEAARVQLSAGEPTANDYQDAIGGGGTVEGDIFGGEQVRPAPDLLETSSKDPVVVQSNSSRAARYDAAWLKRLWSWLWMSWRAFGFAPIR